MACPAYHVCVETDLKGRPPKFAPNSLTKDRNYVGLFSQYRLSGLAFTPRQRNLQTKPADAGECMVATAPTTPCLPGPPYRVCWRSIRRLTWPTAAARHWPPLAVGEGGSEGLLMIAACLPPKEISTPTQRSREAADRHGWRHGPPRGISDD